MEKNNFFILLVIVIVVPLLFFIVPSTPAPDTEQESTNKEESNKNNNKSNKDEEKSNTKEKEEKKENKSEILWGIDSASYTDENLYACVVDNFGQPKVWGRYLGDKEGVSAGLDSNEVTYLHENDVRILVIYNHVNDARGYEHGVEHGKQAISLAEKLEIPKNVALFVDIEPDYPVDSAFMEGWHDTLIDSAYVPAVYGVFNEESELFVEYHNMKQEIQENMIVWTAFPQEEVTSVKNAPEFNPQGPESAMLYGWQYAIDAETCNIDTNLFRGKIVDYLW